MKIKYEFELPDDQVDFDITYNAGKYYSALWEVHELIFRMYKHNSPPKTGVECWDEVKEQLVGILQDMEFDK